MTTKNMADSALDTDFIFDKVTFLAAESNGFSKKTVTQNLWTNCTNHHSPASIFVVADIMIKSQNVQIKLITEYLYSLGKIDSIFFRS